MADNLLETYNPLYDVHLRQYFALPHMQKHLRNVGLLENSSSSQTSGQPDTELYARHRAMMDMLLRNRERVLSQMADLQKKLDAAEKVEIYRRIRSGITSAEEFRRSHMSRSLSRPARSGKSKRSTTGGRQRRYSNCFDDSELMNRIEAEYRPTDAEAMRNHSKNIYNRLAASVYKYQYLHKLDDKTLLNYMHSLKKQLQKLERFRELSFGPNSVAKHHPTNLQTSWFFRRRSEGNLPSLLTSSAPPNTLHHPLRSVKSLRKSRSGKSQSPRKYSPADGYSTNYTSNSKARRPNASAFQAKTRGAASVQRLPPLPKKNMRSSTSTTNHTLPKLPPTAMIKPTLKDKRPATSSPKQGVSPPLSKASGVVSPDGGVPSTTPILPAIGAAAAVGAGAAGLVALSNGGEENREPESPALSVGAAPSEESLPFKYEDDKSGTAGDTETRPTPEPFLDNAVKSPTEHEEEQEQVSVITPDAEAHFEDESVHLQEKYSPKPDAYHQEEKVEEPERHTYQESPIQESPVDHHTQSKDGSPEPVNLSPEPAASVHDENHPHRDKRSVSEDEEEQYFQKAGEQNGSSEKVYDQQEQQNISLDRESTYSEKHREYHHENLSPDHEREVSSAQTNVEVEEPEHILQSHTYVESQEHESHEPEANYHEQGSAEKPETRTYQESPGQHSPEAQAYYHAEEVQQPKPREENHVYEENQEHESTDAYQLTPEREVSPEVVESGSEHAIKDNKSLVYQGNESPNKFSQNEGMKEVVDTHASEAPSEQQDREEHFQRHKRSIDEQSHASHTQDNQQEVALSLPAQHEKEEDILCDDHQCFVHSPGSHEADQPDHSSPEQHGLQADSPIAQHEEQHSRPDSAKEQGTTVVQVTFSPSQGSEDQGGNGIEKHQDHKHQEDINVASPHAISPDQHQEDVTGNHKEEQVVDPEKDQDYSGTDHSEADSEEQLKGQHDDIEEPFQAVYHQQLSTESAISPDQSADVEELTEAIYHHPLNTEHTADSETVSPRSQDGIQSSSPQETQQRYSQDSLNEVEEAPRVSNTDLSARSVESLQQPQDHFESQPTMEVEESNSPRVTSYSAVEPEEHKQETPVSINNDEKEAEHLHPDHFFSPSFAEEATERAPTPGSRKSSILVDEEEHLVPEAAAVALANQKELFSNEHEYNEPAPEHQEEDATQEYYLESHSIKNGGPEHSFTSEVTPPNSGGGNRLLAQPSIEITPASEYGGSVEEHMDRADISTPNSEQAAASPTHEEQEETSIREQSVKSQDETHGDTETPHLLTTPNGHGLQDAVNGNDSPATDNEEHPHNVESQEKSSLHHHGLDESDHHATTTKAAENGVYNEEKGDEEDDSDSVIIHNHKHEHTHLDNQLENGEANGNHF